MISQRRWLAVVTLALATFMISIDINIVALALPPMAKYFHEPATSMPLVTFSYSIALVVFLLPVGQWITRFRPLTLFLIISIGFSLSSVFCGLSQNFAMLLVGRVAQGICAAFITTTGTALAAAIVAPTERGRAMGILGGIATSGSVVGSALGGFLVNYWGWSSVFFVNVPLCVVVVILGVWTLRTISREDAFGSGGSRNAVSAIGSLLRLPRFSYVLLCVCCFSLVIGAIYFLLPFDLSLIQHIPSSTAGLMLLSIPLMMTVFTLVGGTLSDRYGTKPIMLAGVLLIIGGIIAQALILEQPTSVIDIVWRLLLTGCGVGLAAGAVQTLVVSLSPRQTLGLASALSGVARYLGFAVGPLVVSAVWLLIIEVPAQMLYGSLAIVGVSFIGLILAWLATRSVPAPAMALSLEGGQQHSQSGASLAEAVDASSSSQEA